ncbi:MAG TPA: hypothetical protein VGD09_13105 [Blastococcus sp.]
MLVAILGCPDLQGTLLALRLCCHPRDRLSRLQRIRRTAVGD